MKCLRLKLMNILLFMTVHHKLDSCILLQVGKGPRQPSPKRELCSTSSVEPFVQVNFGTGLLQGGICHKMCKGYLEAEHWEHPGVVKGRRGGMAPALGQPEDLDVVFTSDLALEVSLNSRAPLLAWSSLLLASLRMLLLCPISEDEPLPLFLGGGWVSKDDPCAFIDCLRRL